jgi:hypothetical protein
MQRKQTAGLLAFTGCIWPTGSIDLTETRVGRRWPRIPMAVVSLRSHGRPRLLPAPRTNQHCLDCCDAHDNSRRSSPGLWRGARAIDSRQRHGLVTERGRMPQSLDGSYLTSRSQTRITRRSGRGPAYVVVVLPDGRRRSVRIASTDLTEAPPTPRPSVPDLPCISVRMLIPLMQHLSANLNLLDEEAIRDGPLSPSRSRCVSTAAGFGQLVQPADSPCSAPVAEPSGRGANADRSNHRCADAANASDPRHTRKGDGSC